MSFDVSGLSNYTKENEALLVTSLVTGAKTASIIYAQGNLQTGVKSSEKINKKVESSTQKKSENTKEKLKPKVENEKTSSAHKKSLKAQEKSKKNHKESSNSENSLFDGDTSSDEEISSNSLKIFLKFL